jgi:ABC-type transport system involved in Fe-S cluster assembly fused permease/ATPase subunit
MVCGILVRIPLSDRMRLTKQSWKFGWDFAGITVLTMAFYTWYTVRTTAWR